MILGSTSLSNVAIGEVGLWLRGVFAAVLADAGELYNPVYVGPFRFPDTLAASIGAAAAEKGLMCFRGGAPPPGGVWMATPEEADAAIEAGITPKPGVQWVVSSSAAPSALPDRVAGWIGATGLAIDPFAGVADGMVGMSMASAVLGAGSGAAEGERFVVVVGDAADLGSLAAELQLHLELELEAPVWRGPVRGWAPGDRLGQPRVLVVTPGTDLRSLCERLSALPHDACGWGLVLVAEDADRIVGLPEWRLLDGRCVWLRRDSRAGVSIREDVFPALSDLIVGVKSTVLSESVVQFDLSAVSLPEILQSAEGWAKSGRLVIFAADRAGYVELGSGRISDARIFGGAGTTQAEEAEVYRIVGTLASWTDAAGVFVPGAAEAVGVPISRVVMALAHASQGCALIPFPRLRPHEVAELLLQDGLSDVARAYLERAEIAAGWGPEEDLLLGGLSLAREPESASARLRQGALRAFTERGPDGGVSLFVDGMLNALLVEVRGGLTIPSVAWSIVEGWLRDAGTSWATSARHAAIWMELALRAGVFDAAEVAQERLRATAGDRDRCWDGLLGLRIGQEHTNA